jgi:hypothetical protein
MRPHAKLEAVAKKEVYVPYYVSKVQSPKTETHKIFQLVASSMRHHAKLEAVAKKEVYVLRFKCLQL